MSASQRLRVVAVAAVATLLQLSCGGGGGDTGPVAPAPPPVAVENAQVGGQVVSVDGGNEVAGIVVSVDSGQETAVTGPQGRFQLTEVAAGDRTLSFETADRTATMALDNVESREVIDLAVVIEGSQATATSMERDGQPGDSNDDGGSKPGIDLEKFTNGVNADNPPGPTVPVGGEVSWEYVVTNTGGGELVDIAVIDSEGVHVACPRGALAPGQSMTCRGSEPAIVGQYSNRGDVTATAQDGQTVADSDMSHYVGADEEPPPSPGELTLVIQPDKWNTNWAHSSGNVQAKIFGTGFDRIDPASVVMVAAGSTFVFPVPNTVQVVGNHLQAKFDKSEAYAAMGSPPSGAVLPVAIRFTLDGIQTSLTVQVEIVGK